MQDIRHFIVHTTTTTTTTTVGPLTSESPAGSSRKRAKSEVLSSSGAVNKISQQDAEELWLRVKNEKSIVDKAGCWIYPNKPNKKGYVQVAKDNNKKVYTHHLAVRMVLGPKSVPTDRNHNVSHLCGRPSCCNPEHLVVESAEANHARKNCHVVRSVTCPCGCKHTFNVSVCEHTPPCISQQ